MRALNIFDPSWDLAWRALWQKLAPGRCQRDCPHVQKLWHRICRKSGILLGGFHYCLEHCFEAALAEILHRTQSGSPRPSTPHRMPLGLLLLSRQQLTVEQLRLALQAQQVAGRGRIGEWLQALGFVGEYEITAALARQWACPVLRMPNAPAPGLSRAPRIPQSLLQAFVMFPVDYVESTATLYIACGERIDYRILYALEQMLQCHTEPCLAPPSVLCRNLQSLSETRHERETVFDGATTETGEFARIVRSYCARLSASEVRLVRCGSHVWIRLLRQSQGLQDLVMSSSPTIPSPLLYKSSVIRAV